MPNTHSNPSYKRFLLNNREKKVFDSADYFMQPKDGKEKIVEKGPFPFKFDKPREPEVNEFSQCSSSS
jgi:hypothetical protein